MAYFGTPTGDKMETSDFPQDITNEYGALQHSLARAVTKARPVAAKVAWLDALLTLAIADAATATVDTTLLSEWPADPLSLGHQGLKSELSKALSRNIKKNAAADQARLAAMITAAQTALNA